MLYKAVSSIAARIEYRPSPVKKLAIPSFTPKALIIRMDRMNIGTL